MRGQPMDRRLRVRRRVGESAEGARAALGRSDRRASRRAEREESSQDELDGGGVLMRTAVPIRNADQAIVGAVVVSQYVSGDVQARALQATAAYESYQGLRALQGPDSGHLSVRVPGGHATRF